MHACFTQFSRLCRQPVTVRAHLLPFNIFRDYQFYNLLLSLFDLLLLVIAGSRHKGCEHGQLLADLTGLGGAHTARAQQPLQPGCLRLEPV